MLQLQQCTELLHLHHESDDIIVREKTLSFMLSTLNDFNTRKDFILLQILYVQEKGEFTCF